MWCLTVQWYSGVNSTVTFGDTVEAIKPKASRIASEVNEEECPPLYQTMTLALGSVVGPHYITRADVCLLSVIYNVHSVRLTASPSTKIYGVSKNSPAVSEPKFTNFGGM